MDLINPKVFKNMRVVGADDMSDYNYESIRTCILEWYKMIVIKYPESNIVISKCCICFRCIGPLKIYLQNISKH